MEEHKTPPVFNPADYPRRYIYAMTRVDWAVGYFIVMACFFVGTYALTYHYLQNPLPDDYVAFSYAGLMCGLMIAVLMVHRTEVEMTPYEIRIRKNFIDRTLKRQNIKGWCHTRSWIRDADFICLMSLHPKDRVLMLKIDDFKNLEADGAFHAWYKSLPDLGQKEKGKYYEAVARTETLGRTRDERLRNMGYATRIFDWH